MLLAPVAAFHAPPIPACADKTYTLKGDEYTLGGGSREKSS